MIMVGCRRGSPRRAMRDRAALGADGTRGLSFIVLLLAAILAGRADAEVVGWVQPAQPVTEERVAALPEPDQAAWITYIHRSRDLMAADKKSLAAERTGMTILPEAPKFGTVRSMPLDRPADWYGTDAALAIADNIVSFQTPAGGWSKNQDRTAPPRRRGQSYTIADKSHIAPLSDAAEPAWHYVGTIDNGATYTEMRFLARAQTAAPESRARAYRAAFLRGLGYLLQAQFPGGGWPQIYPLQGGYHDAITFNDGAMGEVVSLLVDVGKRQGEMGFVPPERADAARSAAARGIALILRTQVMVAGKRTIWGQQHDALTEKPVGARNFEPAALATDESVGLIRLLSRLSDQRAAKTAVEDATRWLASRVIHGKSWRAPDSQSGRMLVDDPNSPDLWARYYDIENGTPIFGDRDRSIHDDVNGLSRERRNGYSWFNRSACRLLKCIK